MNLNTRNPKTSTIICIVAAIVIFTLSIFYIDLAGDIQYLYNRNYNLQDEQEDARFEREQIYNYLERQKNFIYKQAQISCKYRTEIMAMFHEQDKVIQETIEVLYSGLMDVESTNDAQCNIIMEMYNHIQKNCSDLAVLNEKMKRLMFLDRASNIDIWDLQTERANKVYRKILPNVVSIKGDYLTNYGLKIHNGIVATGVFINNKYVLTNRHVSKLIVNESHQIVLYDNRIVDAIVVVEDEVNDLALLKIDPNDMEGYDIQSMTFSSEIPSSGEVLFVVGSPFGYNNSFAVGSFARLVKAEELHKPNTWYCDIYLLDIQAEGGNSGSPVFNANFEIVGLYTGYYSKFAVSIPGYSIVKFLEENGVYSGNTVATN